MLELFQSKYTDHMDGYERFFQILRKVKKKIKYFYNE